MQHRAEKPAGSHKRLSTWQKATALVPLALLSGAWTTSMTLGGVAPASAHSRHLPDGSTVPSKAIKAPANVPVEGQIAPSVPEGSAQSVISSASTNGIPAAALAAYQRAAQIIDSADPSCHLQWPLIAAIGRVESNHGRFGGNRLGSDGISRPGIYGIPLDGSNGTATVADTDAGQLDHDSTYDRAVGPMQFIPSTWAIVGVDADGDGQKNPQDINDAALATAVYLCSGKEDLSTASGQRSAVYRYNHSQAYVNLVLAIMHAYENGDFTSIPNGSLGSVTFEPAPLGTLQASAPHTAHKRAHRTHKASSQQPTQASGGPSASSTPSGQSSQNAGPTAPSSPTPSPTKAASKVTSTVTKAAKPVVDTISAGAEAVGFCTSHLPSLSTLSSDGTSTVINDCAAKIVGMTPDQASSAIPDTLTGVISWLGLTLTDLLPTGSLTGGGDGSGGGLLGGLG
ncbi:MAG TPA: lytic murein transglycosylase [Nocardioidaceae bacterium]|nr:lytic murein transglycosylase [Nocardioidaceae bacterium]